jgi:crotonobetainyl-CoA:carnitine CoA-transferase CaiB-like acyl-CoA transferase
MINTIKNLKIVELASVLAGPSVGVFFKELGSEVIKIENPKTNGDVTRSWKLEVEDKNQPLSAYYASVNMGKEVLFLDYSKSEDYTILLDILKDADVLVSNFKKGDDLKFRLDYETLHQLFPKLIYALIIGFTNDSDRVAYDLVLQAETGFMSMNGNRNSGPTKMPVALIDILAGHQLKEGVLVALLERSLYGIGRKVTVSLYDAAIASLANQASNFLMMEQIPNLIGSLHPNIAPYGEIFESNDGVKFTLAIGSNKQFMDLMECFDFDSTISSTLYDDNKSRVINRDSLKEILESEFSILSYSEIENGFLEKNIPFGKINSLDEVFDNEQAKRLIKLETRDGFSMKAVKSNVFVIE